MLTELRQKSQITIPKIVESLGLAEGDKLDIFEKCQKIIFHYVKILTIQGAILNC